MTIEKGIPIPVRRPSEWLKTWERMAPGDSFVVPTVHDRNNVLKWSRRNGFKMTSRKLNGEGFRLWRVE